MYIYIFGKTWREIRKILSQPEGMKEIANTPRAYPLKKDPSIGTTFGSADPSRWDVPLII